MTTTGPVVSITRTSRRGGPAWKAAARRSPVVVVMLLGVLGLTTCSGSRAAQRGSDPEFEQRVAMYRGIVTAIPRCRGEGKVENVLELSSRKLAEGERVSVVGALVPAQRECTLMACDRHCCNSCGAEGWALEDRHSSERLREQVRLVAADGGPAIGALGGVTATFGRRDCDGEAVSASPGFVVVTGTLQDLPPPQRRRVIIPPATGQILEKEGTLSQFSGVTMEVEQICRVDGEAQRP